MLFVLFLETTLEATHKKRSSTAAATSNHEAMKGRERALFIEGSSRSNICVPLSMCISPCTVFTEEEKKTSSSRHLRFFSQDSFLFLFLHYFQIHGL